MCTLLKKLKKKFRPMSTRIINHKINYREIMNILMESSTVCWIPKNLLWLFSRMIHHLNFVPVNWSMKIIILAWLICMGFNYKKWIKFYKRLRMVITSIWSYFKYFKEMTSYHTHACDGFNWYVNWRRRHQIWPHKTGGPRENDRSDSKGFVLECGIWNLEFGCVFFFFFG